MLSDSSDFKHDVLQGHIGGCFSVIHMTLTQNGWQFQAIVQELGRDLSDKHSPLILSIFDTYRIIHS